MKMLNWENFNEKKKVDQDADIKDAYKKIITTIKSVDNIKQIKATKKMIDNFYKKHQYNYNFPGPEGAERLDSLKRKFELERLLKDKEDALKKNNKK